MNRMGEYRRTADGFAVDPTVWGILHTFRAQARHLGYAVTVHGSLSKDLDLVAVPWTEEAASAERLVEYLCEETGLFVSDSERGPSLRPHGRKAWSLHAIGWSGYIDLSVMPRAAQPESATAGPPGGGERQSR